MYSWPAPHGRQATCRAFISLLVLITPQLCLSQPPAVIRLKDSDFEQKTQAATGQTTGTWYALPHITLTSSRVQLCVLEQPL